MQGFQPSIQRQALILCIESQDWNQVFNWAGEEAPIQVEGNKGWKKKIEARKCRNEQLRLAGFVKAPTNVSSKKGDGLESHSVDIVLRDADSGVHNSLMDVSSKPRAVEIQTTQASLALTPAMPTTQAIPPPPPGPPPKRLPVTGPSHGSESSLISALHLSPAQPHFSPPPGLSAPVALWTSHRGLGC